MLVIGVIIRVKIMESPMFEQLTAKRSVLKFPAFQVLKNEWRKIFRMLWLNAYIPAVAAFLILPYSVSYLVKLGANESFANLSVTAGTAAAFCTTLLGAYVSDYVGRLKVVRIGAILVIASLYPYFFLLNSLNPVWVIVAQMLLYGTDDIADGVCKAIYTESFPTKYRYSGQGLTHEIGGMITGVLVAIILPVFIVTYGVVGAFMPIVWVLIAMVVACILASFFVKETRGIALE